MWTRTANAVEFVTDDVELSAHDLTHEGKQVEAVGKVAVAWSVDFEYRNWGVKGVYVSVPDQDVQVDLEIYDEASDSNVTETKTIHIENVQTDYEGATFGSALVPTTLSYYKGKWSLDFATGRGGY